MSLLNSQAASLQDQSALAAIKESQHRVQAMALIHQKLYQSESVARIPMQSYINEVVAYLHDSYDPVQPVRFNLSVEPVELDVTLAVPLGLIINEAITNAFKYAFPDGRPGSITLSLHWLQQARYLLTIKDDGVGLPSNYDPSNSRSLGMTLMHGFSNQLGGELTITSPPGLTISLAFAEEHLIPTRTPPIMRSDTTNHLQPVQQTILLVEDEFAVANDLRQMLEKAGYIVSGIAFNVAKALELTRQQPPDLVLIDIHLKGPETGIDLARKLGEDDIPFVYVSANTNSSILEEVKTTQPYGFIVKPFREKDVLVALEIAHYRHAHRLEVRIRQEQTLQIALTDALSEDGDWEQRLLKVVRLFQPYIPFDYFIAGLEKEQTLNIYRSCSFFRIGLDEYQTIQAESFLQMAGLTLEKYQQLRAQIPYDGEAMYNGEEFEAAFAKNPLQAIIAKTFKLQSSLECRFELPITEHSIYTF
jgi:two-component sensor histidine kinase/CheY-like chemotaxis protein